MAIFKLRKSSLIPWLVIVLIYCTRIAGLDADGAPWGVASYQPIDEGTYGNLALNFINFGSINPNDFYKGHYEFLMQPHVISGLLQNLVILPCMMLLGDNYYGLRMGCVAVGLVTVVLAYKSTKMIVESAGGSEVAGNTCGYISACALLFSFPFCAATRVVEPSLFRMLFVLIVTTVLISRAIPIEVKAAASGFLTVISVFLVYVTNVFLGLVLAAYCVYVMLADGPKIAFRYMLFCFLGALAAYGLSFAYYTYWDTTPLKNLFDTISAFANDPTESHSSNYVIGLNGVKENIKAFAIANIELYSIPGLMVFALAIPGFRSLWNSNARASIVVLGATVAGFFLQTVFVQDYVVRKEIVVFPSFIMLATLFVWKSVDSFGSPKRSMYSGVLILLYIVSAFFIISLVVLRCFKINNLAITYLDYSDVDVMALMVVAIATLAVGAVSVFCSLIGTKKALCVCLACFAVLYIGLNSSFVLRYYVLNQTFTDKQICIDLGERVGDGVVSGEFENGFTVYNNIHPLLNRSEVLQKYLAEDQAMRYFDYAGMRHLQVEDNAVIGILSADESYARSFEAFGASRDMALYSFKSLE